MSIRKFVIGASAVAALLVSNSIVATAERTPPDSAASPESNRPWETVDVAIVLDTSGSMEHLIKAARLKLWEIVHELSLFEPTPALRVALVTYGSRANGPASGWVRIESDFTEDLDLLSDRLFGVIQDQGGTEYVTRAILAAVEGLSWTPSDEAVKLLFVAGNESVDQDLQVSLAQVSDLLKERGVFTQLIFCGQQEDVAAESWTRLADWSRGRFATIDHRLSAHELSTPYDSELLELSSAMSQTFVPLGDEGQKRFKRMTAQDEEARMLSPATAASRAEVKTGRLYSSGWDLVDAVASGEKDLYELDESELPETFRAMSLGERESYVSELQARRQELREKIARLSEQRRVYVARELGAKRIEPSATFDTVVRQAIRAQLEERGFRLPEE